MGSLVLARGVSVRVCVCARARLVAASYGRGGSASNRKQRSSSRVYTLKQAFCKDPILARLPKFRFAAIHTP